MPDRRTPCIGLKEQGPSRKGPAPHPVPSCQPLWATCVPRGIPAAISLPAARAARRGAACLEAVEPNEALASRVYTCAVTYLAELGRRSEARRAEPEREVSVERPPSPRPRRNQREETSRFCMPFAASDPDPRRALALAVPAAHPRDGRRRDVRRQGKNTRSRPSLGDVRRYGPGVRRGLPGRWRRGTRLPVARGGRQRERHKCSQHCDLATQPHTSLPRGSRPGA